MPEKERRPLFLCPDCAINSGVLTHFSLFYMAFEAFSFL